MLAILLISQVLRSPRKPAVTMGWILLIIFIPLLGIPLYLAFGERKMTAKLMSKMRIQLPSMTDTHNHPVHSLLISLGIPSSSDKNTVHFHENGQVAWKELCKLLESARKTIDIAIFILGNDQVGREVLSLLARKAGQGVQVRLLLDGVGSLKLPKTLLEPLVHHGGLVAWFIPVLHKPLRGRTNMRNHRKMVIVDHEKIWTGGRNLASEYLGPDCPDNCWIDLSFCQQGPVVVSYQAIFEADWQFSTKTPAEAVHDDSGIAPGGESRIQVVPSGPDVADDPIYAALLTACYEAERRILMVTPYFVPDSGMQEAIKLAALRGVDVDLIMPAKSNHHLADITRNRYLRELSKAGVRIWFSPGVMIHAKALVFDDAFSMAGSANMDIRSLFLNCEVMSCFYSKRDVAWITHWLESLRDRSERHQPEEVGAWREIIEGLIQLGAYQL
ncbi:MAG: cardiolipin synthase [Xanthomonadaceae bacterium]|nr:cardiolipin synthase [Xanthomonadaceae bacterium]